ncbi:MAG: TVP38/TMEM64 family protein [Rhodospirillales bacterium]
MQSHDGVSAVAREAAQPQRRSTQWRLLYASLTLAVTLTIMGGAGLSLFLIGETEGEISVRAFENVILSWGHWGVLASIGLMVVHSFVPFPAELVAFANGMLYGPLWGTVITWVGAMLGALLAFGLSRAFGRPFVEAMVARRHWQRLDDWTGEHAAKMAFLARFLPVISFNLVNYAAGLTRISWWTFGWTTGLGILPMTVLMAAMGDQAGNMPWHWWLTLLAAAALGWVFIQRWLHRRSRRSERGQGPGSGARSSSNARPRA